MCDKPTSNASTEPIPNLEIKKTATIVPVDGIRRTLIGLDAESDVVIPDLQNASFKVVESTILLHETLF
jgi:hypothetical protein